MNPTPIASPVSPDLRAVFDNFKAEVFYGLNCHQVGRIVSYDITKRTASVQISVLRVLGDREVAYPLLTDCPVMFPAGGGAILSFPIKPGDLCLVLFNDRDLDTWFAEGSDSVPNTARAHSLSDGIALVGLGNLARPLPGSTVGLQDVVSLQYNGSFIRIQPTGEVSVAYSIGGGVYSSVVFGPKIRLANNATDLKLVLDELFTVLTNWVNTGGSTPNPATLTAISAAKTTMRSLLTS